MIPFNKSVVTGGEIQALTALFNGKSDSFSELARGQLAELMRLSVPQQAHLTNSATSALETMALISDLRPGDEVIMPAFTFASTANAFARVGAVPVFVDIRADTQNLDETLIEAAITPRTRGICFVHYAGICAEFAEIRRIAQRHELWLFEDAAQAFLSTYHRFPAGTLGDAAAISFHATKGVSCGEGGALILNNKLSVRDAEIALQKGTNFLAFKRGDVSAYGWTGLGGAFAMSELHAAVLSAQLARARKTTQRRVEIVTRYQGAFCGLEQAGKLKRMTMPPHCAGNGHAFYVIFESVEALRTASIALAAVGIQTATHYPELHMSPAGRRFGRAAGHFPNTRRAATRLLRFPVHAGVEPSDVDRIAALVAAVLG